MKNMTREAFLLKKKREKQKKRVKYSQNCGTSVNPKYIHKCFLRESIGLQTSSLTLHRNIKKKKKNRKGEELLSIVSQVKCN